ncbi:hypothetical protein [Alicyclobacillus sp. SO9]|uniref:DODA-type extradiol aromatic ring-opening family dioxygenase n=1 Tax=Alicyclobacillus sp. SO9 TaxID=2665646 RepID=UPI0018E73B1D|nr:hypothetical protein [Alicyclobacillus sp. SO9]
MGELVYACMAPHGYEIIGEIAGPEWGKFAKTRLGMERLGSEMQKAHPDVVIVVTPHGYRVERHIAVSTNAYVEGRLSKFDVEVAMRLESDVQLANKVISNAQTSGLPVIEVCYGSAAGSFSVLPLDWGSFIPLWFMGANWEAPPQVVIVTPSREVGLDNLVEFGATVASTIATCDQRIAVIASADQGHAHLKEGPQGYNPASREYDELVRQAVDRQKLHKLLELDAEFVDAAKPDSLWQIAVLEGIRQKIPMQGHVVSYEVPTYYGLMCASFQIEN